MSGLFHGLEIGKRALLTHQLSLITIGHNMSNVNTPGYTRQRVLVSASAPLETVHYNIGSGITAKTIDHVRDLFLTSQYRRESKSLGEWIYKEKSLAQIEMIFSEPGEQGLSAALDKFWEGWSELTAVDADSSTPREQILANTNALITTFHTMNRQLTDLMASTDSDVVSRVTDINQYSKQIANINRLIASEELGGQNANDLRDQRDYLIDQLSQLVDVTTREEKNGTASVYISGLAIVEHADSFELGTIKDNREGAIKHHIVWKNTSTEAKIKGGELKGLLDIRDKTITNYRNRLDEMAASLVSEVNRIHRLGTDLYGNTGHNYFDPARITAGTIQLNTGVASDSNRISASLSGELGDSSNAQAIYDARNASIMSFGTTSISEYYNSLIGLSGVESMEAKTFRSNYEILIQQIENSRESVQGVSLDEEMANLAKMQHAYNAAARVITTMDQALETIITRMGVVGR